MASLAASKGVSFSLVCAPLRESMKEEVQALCSLAGENGELDAELLAAYRESIVAFPDSLFRDERHFLRESIPDDPCHLFDTN